MIEAEDRAERRGITIGIIMGALSVGLPVLIALVIFT